MMQLLNVLFFALWLSTTHSHHTFTSRTWPLLKNANWSSMLSQPTAFAVKAHAKLRNREKGYQPGSRCAKFVGMAYFEHIRNSRQQLCSTARPPSHRRLMDTNERVQKREVSEEDELASSVDCYTAPYVPVGLASKASISLCRSRNLVLNSCDFFAGKRKGSLTKKFPMPVRGAVRLACDMANTSELAQRSKELYWLQSVHHDVWWGNATRDDDAVRDACAPGSPSLVTTPTLFVMRDRHANYAHELEVVSMTFSFLGALDPQDVAQHGMQVVIVDQAPPTGFLETWARMSRPHRLRILAHDPFPPGTCFRSAYHVYTFAAGIGYNTNPDTIKCESPVTTGLSHWLRQLYDEGDAGLVAAASAEGLSGGAAALATAGPAAAAAGLGGLRPPTGGIVLKNVVWLSRRNLEMVRLLLDAALGWKAMRMVRNEDAVVAALVAAVQEWNAESCLLRRFDRAVQSEYERSLQTVHPVHLGPGTAAAEAAAKAARASRRATAAEYVEVQKQTQRPAGASAIATSKAVSQRRGLLQHVVETVGDLWRRAAAVAGWEAVDSGSRPMGLRRQLGQEDGGSSIDEHGNDEDEDSNVDAAAEEDEDAGAAEEGSEAGPMQSGGDSATSGSKLGNRTGAGQGTSTSTVNNSSTKPPYVVNGNTVMLDKLWETEAPDDECRRTNVLFRFVDGDFNDMAYHQQLKIIFRTGVLLGVHGAGLTHGFFMPPTQSAVLQLLGESFSKVTANNVFRNMAAGLGNYYEDVLYSGVDVDVGKLKEAVKRAMDYVSDKVMQAQRRSGSPLRLVLDDQNHFSLVVPSAGQCPRDNTTQAKMLSREKRK